MRIKQISTPSNPALTLAEAKRQLRIETSETAFDADIEALVKAATEWIFSTCHLTLITTEYRAVFERFPKSRKFSLPAYPISQIISAEYWDADGVARGIFYQADLIQVPAAIYPEVGKEWPKAQADRIDAIIIEVEAGYGATSAFVPEMAKHLLRLLVAHWFKNREAVVTGTISKEVELAADNLMKQLRVNEFESFVV